MENVTAITIESLIEQGNEILQGIKNVPSRPYAIRTYSVHSLADESVYERWKNIVIRFLSTEFPNDISVKDFITSADAFERSRYSPVAMKKMISILESVKAIPTKIDDLEAKPSKAPSVVINNNNSQSQNQVLNIDLFTKAIEDVLTVSQIKELKKVVEEEDGDVEKAKPKLIEKLKSFGENLSSNIVANLLTNPTIWTSLF